MFDFAQARTNMVDCQIHTAGVVSPGILSAFATVPREKFLPDALAQTAYIDEDIRAGGRLYAMAPMVHARLLEAVKPQAEDVALDIGCAGGYSSAVLSSLVSTVLAVDADKALLERAVRLWNEIGACNIVPITADLCVGVEKNAPYDIIMLNGAVAEIPLNIAAQLKPGSGRLACVLKKPGAPMGQAVLVRYLGEKQFSSYTLFDAATSYLEGFSPQPAFAF